MRSHTFISCLLAVLVLAALCPAQKGKGGVSGDRPPQGVGGDGDDRVKAKLRSGEKGDDGEFKKKPEPRDLNLSSAVRATVSSVPARLGPGSTGEVRILLAMQRNRLIEGGAAIQVDYQQQQGPFTFGGFTIDPPKPGRLAPSFIGKPVYETTVLIRVPVSVGSEAPHRGYRAVFSLKSPVTDSMSGRALGLHVMAASGNIEVGKPLPVPRIAGAATGGGSAKSFSGPADVTPKPEPGADQQARRAAGAASMARGVVDVPSEGYGAGDAPKDGESTPASMTVSDEDEPFPMFLLAGGAAFLLLILALVFGKK